MDNYITICVNLIRLLYIWHIFIIKCFNKFMVTKIDWYQPQNTDFLYDFEFILN